jgi:hypothetical protein
MKKLIFILLVLIACNAPIEERHEFKYGIETNESIETNVTYLKNGEYVTEQIQTIDTEIESLNVTQSYWESEVQVVQDDFYAYIEINDSHGQAGWFYFIVNNEIFMYSYISNNPLADISWTFAWYLDLEDDGIDL